MVRSGAFGKHNFGLFGNMQKYSRVSDVYGQDVIMVYIPSFFHLLILLLLFFLLLLPSSFSSSSSSSFLYPHLPSSPIPPPFPPHIPLLLFSSQTTPPNYDVTQMRVSTAVFSGGNDWLATPTDVAQLIPLLRKAQVLYSVEELMDYDHLDFIWGVNARKDIYDVIINDIIAEEKGSCRSKLRGDGLIQDPPSQCDVM